MTHFNVFRSRYCGTPDCGQLYAVQVDKHTETFQMAQTHTRGGVHSMTVVTHCVKCGVALDQAWYENTYTAKPDTQRVHGRDDAGDTDGVIL